jgi:hypothetical protein
MNYAAENPYDCLVIKRPIIVIANAGKHFPLAVGVAQWQTNAGFHGPNLYGKARPQVEQPQQFAVNPVYLVTPVFDGHLIFISLPPAVFERLIKRTGRTPSKSKAATFLFRRSRLALAQNCLRCLAFDFQAVRALTSFTPGRPSTGEAVRKSEVAKVSVAHKFHFSTAAKTIRNFSE